MWMMCSPLLLPVLLASSVFSSAAVAPPLDHAGGNLQRCPDAHPSCRTVSGEACIRRFRHALPPDLLAAVTAEVSSLEAVVSDHGFEGLLGDEFGSIASDSETPPRNALEAAALWLAKQHAFNSNVEYWAKWAPYGVGEDHFHWDTAESTSTCLSHPYLSTILYLDSKGPPTAILSKTLADAPFDDPNSGPIGNGPDGNGTNGTVLLSWPARNEGLEFSGDLLHGVHVPRGTVSLQDGYEPPGRGWRSVAVFNFWPQAQTVALSPPPPPPDSHYATDAVDAIHHGDDNRVPLFVPPSMADNREHEVGAIDADSRFVVELDEFYGGRLAFHLSYTVPKAVHDCEVDAGSWERISCPDEGQRFTAIPRSLQAVSIVDAPSAFLLDRHLPWTQAAHPRKDALLFSDLTPHLEALRHTGYAVVSLGPAATAQDLEAVARRLMTLHDIDDAGSGQQQQQRRRRRQHHAQGQKQEHRGNDEHRACLSSSSTSNSNDSGSCPQQQSTIPSRPARSFASRSINGSGFVDAKAGAPPSLRVQFHNEMAYAAQFPSHVAFAMFRPASVGGTTLLADHAAVTRRLSPALLAKCARLGVRYVTLLHDEAAKATDATFYKSWQQAFPGATSVEQALTMVNGPPREPTGGMEDDAPNEKNLDAKTLTRRQERQVRQERQERREKVAVLERLEDGKRLRHTVWCPVLHGRTRRRRGEEETGAILLASILNRHGSWQDGHPVFGRLPLGERPYQCQWGDGTAFSDAELGEIREAYEAATVGVDLKAGDVIVVDNLRVAHGRTPFEASAGSAERSGEGSGGRSGSRLLGLLLSPRFVDQDPSYASRVPPAFRAFRDGVLLEWRRGVGHAERAH